MNSGNSVRMGSLPDVSSVCVKGPLTMIGALLTLGFCSCSSRDLNCTSICAWRLFDSCCCLRMVVELKLFNRAEMDMSASPSPRNCEAPNCALPTDIRWGESGIPGVGERSEGMLRDGIMLSLALPGVVARTPPALKKAARTSTALVGVEAE